MKKHHKIILGIGVALVVVLIAVVGVSQVVNAGPSKEDYDAARTQTKAVTENYRAIGVARSNYFNTVTADKAPSKTAFDQAVTKYRASLITLGSNKVVKSDDAVKKDFETFKAASDKWHAAERATVYDGQTYRQMIASPCSKFSFTKTDSQIEKAINDCQPYFDRLTKSDEPTFRINATELEDYLNETRPYYAQVVKAVQQGDEASKQQATAKLQEAADNLKGLSDRMRKADTALAIDAKLATLRNNIDTKARQQL